MATAMTNQYHLEMQRFHISFKLKGSSLTGVFWRILFRVSITILLSWLKNYNLSLYLDIKASNEAASEAIEIQVELCLKVLPLTVDSRMRLSFGVT